MKRLSQIVLPLLSLSVLGLQSLWGNAWTFGTPEFVRARLHHAPSLGQMNKGFVRASRTQARASACEAIISSERIQRLAQVVKTLQQTQTGRSFAEALVDRACKGLLDGTPTSEIVADMPAFQADWMLQSCASESAFRTREIVDDMPAFQDVGTSSQQATDAIDGIVGLCSFRGPSCEVIVLERVGQQVVGSHSGKDVRFRLQQSPPSAQWGEYTQWELADCSSTELQGLRVVACTSIISNRIVDSVNDLQEGDRLIAVSPDRAAIGDLILYDQLPDRCADLQPSVDVGIDVGIGSTTAAAELLADADIREASNFASKLERTPIASDRIGLRLRRLLSSPLVQEVLSTAKADDDLAQVLTLLQPSAPRLYASGRAAMDRQLQDIIEKQATPQLPGFDPAAITRSLSDMFQSLR